MPVPVGAVKPSVAFVHSGPEFSDESSLCAHFLAGCLFLAGYSNVHVAKFATKASRKRVKKAAAGAAAATGEGGKEGNIEVVEEVEEVEEANQTKQTSIKLVPYGKRQPVTIDEGVDFHLGSDLSVVAECQLVVVMVDSADTEKAAEKLSKLIPEKASTGVFCLQHGVKNYACLEPA